jgi:CubicO group peptidase (beta-lactamase class C family)
MDRREFLKYGLAVAAAGLTVPSLMRTALAMQEPSDDLGRILDRARERNGVPALAGAVVRSSGAVAVSALGVRRAEASDPVRRDDHFLLGSCTKSMTATLVARLVEQGRLSWIAQIGEVLPELLGRIHPGYYRATLQQLLAHRAGLPEDGVPDPEVWSQIVSLTGPMIEQRHTMAALVLSLPPVAEPGRQMVYTNFGYVIAGAMAERVTGQDWETLMRDVLFEPLGMTTAGFGMFEADQPWGHMEDDEGLHSVLPGIDADNPPVIGPAATVHSAMSDWARYAALHLRGARGETGLLLSPESFRELHRDHSRQGYGLGWFRVQSEWAKGLALMHAGANSYWYAEIWIAPARDAAFLVACNSGSLGALRACSMALNGMVRRYL